MAKKEELLDLQALEYFVRVSEMGSFSRASAILNVSQPTLSRHIQQLETHCGARLFCRTGHGVALTEAGDTLLGHAKLLLQQAAHAYAELLEFGSSPSIVVVLGLAPAAWRVLNSPVAKRFVRKMPNGKLRIVEMFTRYVHEWIANGRIDVGILYDDGISAYTDGELLWDEHYFLVGPRSSDVMKGRTIRFEEVRDLPLITSSAPNGMRIKIDQTARTVGIPLNVKFEVDSLPAILDLVCQGAGYAILTAPALHGFSRLSELATAQIVDPIVSSTAIMVKSSERPATNASRLLMQIIREHARTLRSRGALDSVPGPAGG